MRPRFVIGKVAGSLGTLAFVLVFNFFLFRVVTDDPVGKLFRGRNLTPEQIDAKRREFNLDGSKLDQFLAYISQTLRGNLGDSILSGRPVTTEIREALWPTLFLVGTSTVLSMLIGVLLGIHAGWKRRSSLDVGATSFSMITYSVPDFWIGMLLLAVFSIQLDLLPTGGFECSPLSCNGLAASLTANRYCLFDTLEAAMVAAERFSVGGAEPGSYYVVEVWRQAACASPAVDG